MQVLSQVKAGWGDWAGPGENNRVSEKILASRQKLLTKIQTEHDTKVAGRKDTGKKLMGVMISERRIKTASKYKIADIPHPFTTREEYERSLRMPIGDEWNASNAVMSLTQPEIKTRAGRLIEPTRIMKKKNYATTTPPTEVGKKHSKSIATTAAPKRKR